MAKLLEDAYEELQQLLSTITGLRSAPDYPPDKPGTFPFLVVFPASGTFAPVTFDGPEGAHTVIIQIHVARKDLARDLKDAIPYVEKIAKKLLYQDHSNLNSTVDDIGELRYTFGDLEWGGVPTLGYSCELDIMMMRDDL